MVMSLGHYGLKVSNAIEQGEVFFSRSLQGSSHCFIYIEIAALKYAVGITEFAVNDQRPSLQLGKSVGNVLRTYLGIHAGQ